MGIWKSQSSGGGGTGTGVELGETSTTAYRGDRGKASYDHSQVTHDKTLVGLANVDNTTDLNKPISTLTQTALDAKANDTAVVKLTGNQTIADTKIFTFYPQKYYPLATDYYLPTLPEMELMYNELKLNSLGGFASSNYWTATEIPTSSAYYKNFNTGASSGSNKANAYRARAVRTFTTTTNYNLRDTTILGGLIFNKVDNGDGTFTYKESTLSDAAVTTTWDGCVTACNNLAVRVLDAYTDERQITTKYYVDNALSAKSDTTHNHTGTYETANANIQTHIANITTNPHSVTKTQVGLANVVNLDTSNPTNITQDATHRFATDSEKTTWNSKQDALVSGTNIKTINSTSLLGSGDIAIAGGSSETTETIKTKLGVADTDSDGYLTYTDWNTFNSKASSTHNHTGTYELANSNIQTHISSTSNPHSVTKTQVGLSNVDNIQQLPLSQKGTASGVAELDATGKVLTSQLPSYVDDVLEYADLVSFPATGETSKIYVDLLNNKTYRWSGTIYVEISASIALGETSTTAYRGDRGKTAYDHSQVTHDKTLVGLGNVVNLDTSNPTNITQDATHRFTTDTEKTTWNSKQDALVSGTSIKTINNQSLLGSGDIAITGGGGSGGLATGASVILTSSDVVLNSSSSLVQSINTTASNISVTLPDATTLEEGISYFITNDGNNAFYLFDNGNNYTHQAKSHYCCIVKLLDNSTANGIWKVSSFLTDVKEPIVGTSQNKTNVVSSENITIAKLTENKSIVCFCDDADSNKGKAFIITNNKNATTIGTVLTFHNYGTYTVNVARLSDTKAVVVWQGGNGNYYGRCCVLNIADTTITQGTEAIFNNATTGRTALTSISETHALVAYRNNGSGSYGTAQVLTITGDTITTNTPAVFNSGTTSEISLSAVSATKFFCFFINAVNDYGIACILDIAGTSITPTAIVEVTGVLTVIPPKCFAINSTKVILSYTQTSGKVGTKIIDITGNVITDYIGTDASENNTQYPSIIKIDEYNIAIICTNISVGTGIINMMDMAAGNTLTLDRAYNFLTVGSTRRVNAVKVGNNAVHVVYSNSSNSDRITAQTILI